MSESLNELTKIVHGGESDLDHAGAVNVPVYFTSSFKQNSFEDGGRYGYARGNNPSRESVERLIATIENAKFGFGFSSGMAATQAAVGILSAGDNILVSESVYGGTYGTLEKIFSRYNISYTLVDTSDVKNIEAALKENTKAIFIETPANPTLSVTDIKAVADFAKAKKLLTILDNTFMSPYLQKPLNLGIDIVVESATKYLGGHSDIIAGIAATNDEKLAEELHTAQVFAGGIMQPFDAFLLTRGIRTLGVRLDRQVENAEKLVSFLNGNEAVKSINYPGLPTDPGYEIQKKQAKNGGAMISFELADSYDISKFFNSLELITLGSSLGGVETLIGHPVTSSHRGYPKELRDRIGISDRLIRLSLGIEYADDLIADLKQAFDKAKQ